MKNREADLTNWLAADWFETELVYFYENAQHRHHRPR